MRERDWCFPGKYTDVAKELDLSSVVVSKIWKQYCQTSSFSPLKKHTGNPFSLSDGDLQLIEVMKIQKPSPSFAEILDTLFEICQLGSLRKRLSATLFEIACRLDLLLIRK